MIPRLYVWGWDAPVPQLHTQGLSSEPAAACCRKDGLNHHHYHHLPDLPDACPRRLLQPLLDDQKHSGNQAVSKATWWRMEIAVMEAAWAKLGT